MAKKWVYLFEESNVSRSLLGGKGAGLAEMTRIGLPIPPGFIITTEAWKNYCDEGNRFPEDMWKQTLTALKALEEKTGKYFGSTENPLLVSVRSGAALSMPGMMDTILNVGMERKTLKGLIFLTNDNCFAHDTYLQFIQTFGHDVLGISEDTFRQIRYHIRAKHNMQYDQELNTEALLEIIDEYEALISQGGSVPFDNPYEQLRLAINAVFKSWFSDRAKSYRHRNHIRDDLGTACIVQAMVFGNMSQDSGSGVLFTRDTKNGEKVLSGEYLTKAQGHDIVSGTKNPKKIDQLQEEFPNIYNQLLDIAGGLERHYHDIQDVEFTFERSNLWILQTRSAKPNANAAGKIAIDMLDEGLISDEDVIRRVSVSSAVHSRVPRFNDKSRLDAIKEERLLGRGLGAVPGAATGMAMISIEQAIKASQAGQSVILVRPETNPRDAKAMPFAQGILTARGGDTSHAALIAQSLSKPCIVGCQALNVSDGSSNFTIGNRAMRVGDVISIDGSTGEVFSGQIEIEPSKQPEWISRYQNIVHSVWERTAKLYGKANQDIHAKSKQIWANSKCETEKAKVVELLNIIPPRYRILELPIKAHDRETLETKMLDVIHEKKWVGLRTCYRREQPFGQAPWHMAIRTEEDVAKFFNNEDFRTYIHRDCKMGGGYSSWIKNPDLSEIIVLYNPPELGLSASEYPEHDPSCEQKHFVLTVSTDTASMSNDYEDHIVINLKLKTDQLRSFEIIDRDELIRIEMPLRPDVPVSIDSCKYSFFGKEPICFGEITSQANIDPRAARIALQVARTIFEEWWSPQFNLPGVMWAMQSNFDLDTLEVQGRIKKNDLIEYILVYEFKGREERKRAQDVGATLLGQ